MVVAMLVPVLFLAGLTAGWAIVRGDTEPRSTPGPSPPATAAPVSLPRNDAPGEDLAGLPRYPGSVRADYERTERANLVLTNVRYLAAGETPDTVRGFYRGVFRSESWEEGDADFTGGVWTFFVTHGEHEATVEIEPRGPDVVEINVRLSEPKPEPRPEPGPAEEAATDPASAPAAPVQEQYAPVPTPQYFPQDPVPAPVYGGGYDDDGGGDD